MARSKARRIHSLLVLVGGLCGCLEEEECLVVRADGSARVTRSIASDAEDLAHGHPLPTEAPWRPLDEATRAYLADPAAFRARRAGEARLRLSVEAEVARLEELPAFAAPASEPYREAYLERRSSLAIESRGARTLYAFERRYPARAGRRLDPRARLAERLDASLLERLEKEPAALSLEEWRTVATAYGESLAESAPALLRRAFVLHLGEGERPARSVPLRLLEPACAAARASVERSVPPQRLERLARLAASALAGEDAPSEGELSRELEELERDQRAALRAAVAETLAGGGASEEATRALLGALEQAWTALDHTSDLGDERFTLRVTLPGVVVEGNYDELEGSTATWTFAGDALRDRELVLHALSVVE